MLAGKRILLIIGGGIAAYKSLELIRLYQKAGASVVPVLTRAAEEFVTPLSASALAGEKVYRDLFDLTDEAEMGHIELSRAADLVVVAPATADLMAKMVAGLASDLASTLLMATDKRVLIAPAMNVRMWEHAATKRNLAGLRGDGVLTVGPDEGDMACGEFGFGRMAEPPAILAATEAAFGGGPLSGRHVLVTSGPTHEPIDPVRYIANHSSGKQGYAIAEALNELGADVTLVSGPTSLAKPPAVDVVSVETAAQMLSACERALPVEIAVMCAAVADYRPEHSSASKLKKEQGPLTTIELAENPDILQTISAMENGRPKLVVGFAAETDNVLENARNKRARKKCDWIVANDVSKDVMGGDQNTITIVSGSGETTIGPAPKGVIARQLAAKIADAFNRA
ncbi:MAG: bifunctional phosphopantothenoylcysteine decarboxylase/phosphopantothenate--cysteine ligase CoaBC [Planctomycetota bacterium]